MPTGHNYLPLRPGHSTESDSCDVIREVPRGDSTLRFIFPDGIGYFYDKYTEAYGIPVMGENLRTILYDFCKNLEMLIGFEHQMQD